MKLLFLIFLIYLNYGSTQRYPGNNHRYVLKSYPKKVHSGMFQINFSNKYINQNKLDDIAQNRKTQEKKYTAFVPIDTRYIHNVPESLLFPNPEVPSEQKSRIKKVLPDYVWSRVKRSAPAEVKKPNVPVAKPKSLRAGAKAKKAKGGARLQRNSKKGRKAKKGAKRSKKSKVRAGNKKGSKGKNQKLRVKVTRNKPKGKKEHKRSAGGGTPVDGRRLIAARDATIEEYPYVISIQKNREHWCSGALLNSRLIITTANCMWKSQSMPVLSEELFPEVDGTNREPMLFKRISHYAGRGEGKKETKIGNQISRMKVRVGSRYTDQGGQLFKIQEVMRHPGWKIRGNPDCDVALALLNGNVRFSHAVHGVDLPNHAMMPAFDDAWVTSWGSERRDGVYESDSNALQVYHVRLMDHDKCNNITQRFRVSVTENFICLAQAGRRAPCTRDTGAPAVSDGVLWGLASWGIRKLCGTERFPAMFTYLASPNNMEFLINATHLLMADERNYPFPDHLPRIRVAPTVPTAATLPYY